MIKIQYISILTFLFFFRAEQIEAGPGCSNLKSIQNTQAQSQATKVKNLFSKDLPWDLIYLVGDYAGFNTPNTSGMLPLQQACKGGSFNEVIAFGYFTRDIDGTTEQCKHAPLRLALHHRYNHSHENESQKLDSFLILQYLIHRKANLEAVDGNKYKMRPINFAIETGDLLLLKTLIHAGAKLNYRNGFDQTLVDHAWEKTLQLNTRSELFVYQNAYELLKQACPERADTELSFEKLEEIAKYHSWDIKEYWENEDHFKIARKIIRETQQLKKNNKQRSDLHLQQLIIKTQNQMNLDHKFENLIKDRTHAKKIIYDESITKSELIESFLHNSAGYLVFQNGGMKEIYDAKIYVKK